VKGKSEAMLNYINEIVEKVRSISYNLRPQVLDLGLTAALNSLLREFQMDQNMELSMDICPVDGLFSSEEQVGIYPVFQEALTNIVKHAQATRVTLTAKRQGGLMAFQINDKGQGFDLKKVQSREAKDQRLGLATMEDRVRLLGGNLKVSSVKGTGTSVSFTIPISSAQKAVD
jgi:signal transduction histidine kinase